MNRGAIILCGGRSARMGRDKATLPFGPDETMLARVVRLVGCAVPAQNIVCMAAADQDLPPLLAGVRIVCDTLPYSGPLAGLAEGIAAIRGEAEVVFVSACDMPLLEPRLVVRMFELLGEHQIAVPHDGERWHPLAAVYRCNILPEVESLLTSGERRMIALFERCSTRRVGGQEIRDVDPDAGSLRGCNTRAEYEALVASQKS